MIADRFKEYFSFSKKERAGIITLLTLIIFTWFLPDLFYHELTEQEIEVFSKAVEFKESSQAATGTIPELAIQETRLQPEEIPLFYFDPNTLNRNGWEQLGLPEKVITTIENYRSKGGKFFTPEDIRKVYGLKKEDYERLYPFIRIKKDEVPQKTVKDSPKKIIVVEEEPVTDINKADSISLRKLRGVGNILSRRIVLYREKLGGFYNVEQLKEVYGLPDSTFQHIRAQLVCDAADIKRINLNTADLKELSAHPYIKYQVAAAVIAYRKQHGSFNKTEDLKQIHLLPEDIYDKIAPYLITGQ
ncbi:MAG: helix-hairpin-helix domain-containing protein [Chitinophagaceae bacterium]|nr:helix-hairpin-helix domain-containing protein [Chitinophagaceae bacterium]MCW5929341.1 helix-hairpin-helix domain-containing protein [Chitinophagaceae bacterium]